MSETPLKRPWLWSIFGVLLLALPVAATLAARARPRLPKLGQVPSFHLTDQTGQPLDGHDLDGKVWVVDFIFTSCSQICPRLTGEMAKLERYLENRGQDAGARLLSITVDPERDTPERLAAYAAGFHADPKVWRFGTGPAKEVEAAVVRGFKTSMTREPDDGSADGFSILHGTRMILVDARGQIRGFYDAEDVAQMSGLRRDIALLLEKGGS